MSEFVCANCRKIFNKEHAVFLNGRVNAKCEKCAAKATNVKKKNAPKNRKAPRYANTVGDYMAKNYGNG
jgi:hypothetical protein